MWTLAASGNFAACDWCDLLGLGGGTGQWGCAEWAAACKRSDTEYGMGTGCRDHHVSGIEVKEGNVVSADARHARYCDAQQPMLPSTGARCYGTSSRAR